MLGFDVLYKQTITLFNRVTAYGDELLWYPTVIEGVHLIVDKSSAWNSYGGQATDNARVHVRYTVSGDDIIVAGKKWVEPKAYRRLERQDGFITFSYGDNDDFDFFIEGVYEGTAPIPDNLYERRGFYNFMNSTHDNVFAVKSVSKYNLIPHFEIMAR